ncbi:hypothetical protein YYC_04800 [Plasmodium yoelii 17X]|uniref:PYST-C1-like N-terminal domain-containing protein n=1 Tax=Plasmodium yoelii 17X TaxID=1323249 RepID=V7PD70_PLAYE|nr:hypothetical protein YYC_04800 [Plasmodium yoelii 17X]
MNKRIFSLVCIVLYSLLAVLVHCSEQKVFDVGNKSIRGTKERNKSNEKHDIEYKHKTQLKNNNPKDDEDDRGFNCFDICKRNKKIKPIINDVPVTLPYNQIVVTYSNNESLPTVTMRMGQIRREFIPRNQKHLEDILKLQKIFEKLYSNNEFLPMATIHIGKNQPEFIPKNQEHLKDVLQLKESFEKIYSNNESLPMVTMRMGKIQGEFIPKNIFFSKIFLLLKEELEKKASKLKTSE